MHNSLRQITLAILVASLTACGGDSGDQDGYSVDTNVKPAPENPAAATRTLAFSVDVASALSAGISASRVEVRVYNDLLERRAQAELSDQAASVSFSALPLGSYSIAIEVYDGDTLIATGSGTAQVGADSTSAVSLVLNPVTGNLDVAICMPDIATQYFNGIGAGSLYRPATEMLAAADSEPAAQAYHAAFDAASDVTYSFRVGDTSIPVPAEGEVIPLHTDHGALLSISDSNGVLMDLSGCNTRLLVTRQTNQISLWYAMPQAYDAQFDIKSAMIVVGSILSDALGMVVTLTDSDGDAGVADAESLSDIDFSRFDSQTLTLGVPVPGGFTGTAGLIFSEPQSLIDQQFFYSQTE
ncbi:hypothetical protein ACQUQU_16175 [Thalassolituus sp. LLYu03]|uniref:hypothetical protein n=1 Tax=Thalassolituus sp. LLYu03 TaxID=3421656 RepID=UPI003D2D1BC8